MSCHSLVMRLLGQSQGLQEATATRSGRYLGVSLGIRCAAEFPKVLKRWLELVPLERQSL